MTPRVIVLLRVPCSPVQAFDIFMQQIGAWWADSPLFHLTPRSPGKLAFEPPAPGYPGRLVEMLPNGKVFEIGPVHDWKPGERLLVGWRMATFGPGHTTEVEVRFEPVGAENPRHGRASRLGQRSAGASGAARLPACPH